MADNNEFVEYKEWVVRSINSLLEAVKEHDTNLGEKFSELKDLINRRTAEINRIHAETKLELIERLGKEASKRKDLEADIKVIKDQVSRRATAIVGLGGLAVILANVLIIIFT